MVIPNMGAFIAWGFITALFIPAGWIPNEAFAQIVDPMIKYVLPLLLAYTGGTLVAGQRGGVVGVIGTTGLIVGASIPMFLGAMIMGPLSAWLVKKFDKAIDGKIPAGFEMLVNSFSLGLIGLALCLLSFEFIGPLIELVNGWLTSAIEALVSTGFLPILSVLNEPAKVLFLNNVIDQGIYYPLGMQQAATAGKSIFFMVASNPGTGLGLLIAFWRFGATKTVRQSAPGAMIIQFLGGIHEIYFPYVLMRPMTIFAMIAGGAAGTATFQLFGSGLVAGPSPGSIFAYLLLTPRGGYVGVIAGVVVAGVVSFLLTSLILLGDKRKARRKGLTEEDLENQDSLRASEEKSRAMKQQGKQILADSLTASAVGTAVLAPIHKIVFACDAGMGSSTMGASVFRKKLSQEGLAGYEVENTAIEKIPDDADVVVVHQNLVDRTRKARPDVRIVAIQNYMNDPAIADLLESLSNSEDGSGDGEDGNTETGGTK